jgi:hypothetical protein
MKLERGGIDCTAVVPWTREDTNSFRLKTYFSFLTTGFGDLGWSKTLIPFLFTAFALYRNRIPRQGLLSKLKIEFSIESSPRDRALRILQYSAFSVT